MTQEVKESSKKDELTEEEYLASCLSKLKRNRDLRHGAAQEAENTISAVNEQKPYKVEVEKWYLHSTSPELVKALSGEYGAEERVRAKESVFKSLKSEGAEVWDLILYFCRICYSHRKHSDITELLIARFLSEVNENLHLLMGMGSVNDHILRSVIFYAATGLAVSNLEDGVRNTQDEISFRDITCRILKEGRWVEYRHLFSFIGRDEKADESLFFPFAGTDLKRRFWAVRMIPVLRYLCEILIEEDYLGEAYGLRQRQKMSLIDNGICTKGIPDAWEGIREKVKPNWLRPLNENRAENGEDAITLADSIIEKTLSEFAVKKIWQECKTRRQVRGRMLLTDIEDRINKMAFQDAESARTVSNEVGRFIAELETWTKDQLPQSEEEILNFTLCGLDMFLAFSERGTSLLTKNYLAEIVRVLQEGREAIMEELRRKGKSEWFCIHISSIVFKEMVGEIIKTANIYDTIERIGGVEIPEGSTA